MKEITITPNQIKKAIQDLVNENERLNNKVEELMTLYTTERNVKEDYKAIIKEAIEYIESYMPNYDFDKTNLIKLLEILKGENNENNSISK